MNLEELLAEGREAHTMGKSISDNPYCRGTAAWWNWLTGFEQEVQKQNELNGDEYGMWI